MNEQFIEDLPNSFVIDLDGKIHIQTLAAILGINPAELYNAKAKGILPQNFKDTMSYRQAIAAYIAYYRKSKPKTEVNFTDGEINDRATELALRKMEQDIKLNRSKELEIWVKIAEQRQKLINVHELIHIFEPFIVTIKNILLSLRVEFPMTKAYIDSTLKTLHELGEAITATALQDQAEFIETMLNTDAMEEISLEEIKEKLT